MDIRNVRALTPFLTIALAIGVLFAGSPRAAAQGQGSMSNMQGMNMSSDLHYIDMMLMHHRQGIEMANLAATRAQNARVKAFAQKTAADQQRDSDELKKLRDQFYAGQPEMKMDDMNMQGMGNMQGTDMKGMKGMDMKSMEATMNRLRAASGAEFDRQFLDAMISHHQMAIEMSKDPMTNAEHSEVKDFARRTRAKQWGEVGELNKLKSSLGGTTAKKASTRKRTTTRSKSKKMPGMKMPGMKM